MDEKDIHKMIRVNQAGEYGATRIYQGQLAVFKGDPLIQKMADQEAIHLKKFNQLLIENKVRSTLLQPIWHVAGYLLGVTTALAGKKAAHACTIAVETVIDKHYQEQLDRLKNYPEHGALRELVEECHLEELEHRDAAIQEGGETAPGYSFLSEAVQSVSRLAIWLSTRV